MPPLTSPYEGLYTPTRDAVRAWNQRHRGTAVADALTAWTSTTAHDGRPLHTARVDCPDAVNVLTRFVNNSPAGGVNGDQQRPVLDYSVPGRIGCLWLLDGEWIELWAPDGQAPVPEPRQVVGLTPAMADALPASVGNGNGPSGRLSFTRRNKTPKETPAA
ncbi:hypothetical protein ACFQ0X_43940 [Streptomyces rectiviolaceus]|uniref:Uncharacterized protein n=1 Tax=Streptomyces rectiviolaceus TaxID=332591 RepID=A0ABP6NMX3_9ACTN